MSINLQFNKEPSQEERIFVAFYEDFRSKTDVNRLTGISRVTIDKYIEQFDRNDIDFIFFSKGKRGILLKFKHKIIIDGILEQFKNTHMKIDDSEKKILYELLSDEYFDNFIRHDNKNFEHVLRKIGDFFSNVFLRGVGINWKISTQTSIDFYDYLFNKKSVEPNFDKSKFDEYYDRNYVSKLPVSLIKKMVVIMRATVPIYTLPHIIQYANRRKLKNYKFPVFGF